MEILRDRYPKKLVLGGAEITVRPMVKEDEEGLRAFFQRIPIDDRRLLKHDVRSPETIKSWCEKVDYEKVLPLLALDGERVVGDATLHRERGWMGHVARVRLVVDPDYRGKGIGRALIQEFLELARRLEVALIDGEAMAEQRGAIRLFESLDFVVVATLPQHALDLVGKAHDIVVLSHEVFPPAQLAVDRDTKIEDLDLGGSG